MTVEYLNFGGCERLQAGRKVTAFTMDDDSWIGGEIGKEYKSV